MDSSNKLIHLAVGKAAIVDADWFPILNKWRWRAVRNRRAFYARLCDGQDHPFKSSYMHRIVAATPPDKVCHHKNRCTLDNTEENLHNMFPTDHDQVHKNNTLQIKFKEPKNQDNTCTREPAPL